jgi:anti-anti-sigma factor
MADQTVLPHHGLAIAGEFNIFTAAETKTRLLEVIQREEATDVEIDLSEVTEIDSAGLQLMVLAKREGTSLGRTVRFTGHSACVLDLIDLCGLSGFFGDPLLIRSNS